MSTLRLAGIVAIFVPLALILRDTRRRNRRRAAAVVQACWDHHVADVIEVTETPIFDALVMESANDLDAEWRTATTTGWAAP